ncbi:MAG: ATP-binding cassette domain-containing protein [Bacilli bacterium]|nr:ATP-binding cassette domain-containing protein [Bacilli bacterium]
MERSIIKVKNMSFKYNEEYLFKDLDLEIKAGTFVSIIGKNGSGKSTLAKILIGILKSEGYITIDGYLQNDFFLKKIRRVFSVCFDNADNHFIGETVRNDLAFSLENLEYSREEIKKSIEILSKKFKLENILDKSPDEINSSEKEKVAIASALIHNPKIILLDESIHKLTPSDKKLVFKILKEYQEKQKLTIILITHNLEDTLISDRIVVLDKGNIIFDDTKEKIYEDDKLEKLNFNLPFIVKLSHNLMLYNLLDRVYFNEEEVVNKLWQ